MQRQSYELIARAVLSTEALSVSPQLQRRLAPDFLDRTLPTGRPQGKPGVLQASNGFRQAVPDLRASVEDLIISGDKVVLRLRFTGHFTGKLGTKQGQGQRIDFVALDM
mgnify:CR=1 FL=1